MKLYSQAIADCQNITQDSSGSSQILFTTLINLGVKKFLGMSNWTFNKGTKYYSTGTNIQDYDPPYDSAKIEYVNVWYGNVWYAPKEVRDGNQWTILNSVESYSSIPQYWYVSNRSKKIKLFPIPTDVNGTIKVGYLKKTRNLSTTDYSTGSVWAVKDTNVFNGYGTSWGSVQIGRYLSTGTVGSSLCGGFYFEIDNVSTTGSLSVKESIPESFGSSSYTISDAIPMPEGFEELPMYYSLEQYYQIKEKPALAREYERMWKEGVEELINRDSRSATNLITKQGPIEPLNPNENPWGITLS